MFNPDFYPTETHVIDNMIDFAGISIEGKVIFDPEGGKGNIVDYCKAKGAKDVISCEIEPDLRKILQTKCKVIANDFFTVTSDMISHVDHIIMNPPFSKDEQHILHAFEIAPPGCTIIALCNTNTIKNAYSKSRLKLQSLIEDYGYSMELGACFTTAERKTNVEVTAISLTKPGEPKASEFDGFFTEQEQEVSGCTPGVMPYNVVRDLVNRYTAAVRLYDQQLAVGIKMNGLLRGFYGEQLTFTCTEKGQPKLRNDFKKDMQKEGWKFIFKKMDMARFATRGLKEDINKFVETQQHYPFTMKNIYRMLEIVAGTQSQRMDKAIIEVAEKLLGHHHDNRMNIEGWKTNSHILINRKFILPNMCYQDQRWDKGPKISTSSGSYFDFVEDLVKALCYITGDNYELFGSLRNWITYPHKIVTDSTVHYCHSYDGYDSYTSKKKQLYEKGIANNLVTSEPVYGKWFDWAYFRCKAFKKGTMHFEFKDPELCAKMNQRISRIKGYPLFEGKAQTAYQNRQTGRQKKSTVKKAA
jgi:predicted RNA methylase